MNDKFSCTLFPENKCLQNVKNRRCFWSYTLFEAIKQDHAIEFSLKPEQVEILNLITTGNNVLAVLPTNFGKSCLYTLPPILLEKVGKLYRYPKIIKNTTTDFIGKNMHMIFSESTTLSDFILGDFIRNKKRNTQVWLYLH